MAKRKIETPPLEATFDNVMTLARRWYYSEVRDLADESIKATVEHATDTDARTDAIQEWLTETIDGCQLVIYTAQAAMVCAASDNYGAYEDECREKPPTVEVQAFAAMRADVWQLLSAREDEWHAPETEDES